MAGERSAASARWWRPWPPLELTCTHRATPCSLSRSSFSVVLRMFSYRKTYACVNLEREEERESVRGGLQSRRSALCEL